MHMRVNFIILFYFEDLKNDFYSLLEENNDLKKFVYNSFFICRTIDCMKDIVDGKEIEIIGLRKFL